VTLTPRKKRRNQERRNHCCEYSIPKKEGSFATRESGTRCVSFERLPKKEPGVLHSYGVALIRKEKGERSIAEKEV
jgi:hypothetical protein